MIHDFMLLGTFPSFLKSHRFGTDFFMERTMHLNFKHHAIYWSLSLFLLLGLTGLLPIG